MKKRNKRRSGVKIFLTILVSFMMVFAAVSGIYLAKLYTTPYSSVIREFDEDTLDEVVISEEKCNILIMGTDKEGTRTDVIMLAQIDPKNGKSVVMSIPRDTRVKYAGAYRKLTKFMRLV